MVSVPLRGLDEMFAVAVNVTSEVPDAPALTVSHGADPSCAVLQLQTDGADTRTAPVPPPSGTLAVEDPRL